MKNPVFLVMFASYLAAGLSGCGKDESSSRKKTRPISEEEQPEVVPPVIEVPVESITPSESIPMTPTDPTPAITVPAEELLILSCDAAFTDLSNDTAEHFETKVEVSSLDQNKTTELAQHKGEIIELTSHMGHLTLTKRTAEKKGRNEATATMQSPLLALVDEASEVPATITCETTKTIPAQTSDKFKCEGQISLLEANSANNAGDTITRKVVTFSMEDQDKRVVLATHAHISLVAYSNGGELILAAESNEDWLGAAVGSIADELVAARMTTEKLVLEGRCEKLAQ